ncbi:MAG: site-2 protease family protein [Deltaproteobacteria bacterium]|nr:site-2 protease family protein [Deltaproteobacteria bacterium]
MESLTLFTVRGIPLRVHFTMLLAVPYFALVIAAQLPALASAAGVDTSQLWLPPLAWGVLLAFGLFVSVALHEFGHSLVALRSGRKVHSVTLMLLGGVSHIDQLGEDSPGEQKREAVISAMGPLVSLVLALILYVLTSLARGHGDLRFLCFYLAQINLMIGLFNLLPAFPLDGGRILRALLAWRFGFDRGTKAAVTVGQCFAAGFIMFSIMSMNLILMLIAIFIFAAGSAEARLVEVRKALSGLTAGDVMHQAKRRLDAGVPVSQALESLSSADGEQVPVVQGAMYGKGGRIVGLVDLSRLERIPQKQRDAIPVGLAANHDVPTIRSGEPAGQVLELLVNRGPVVAVVDEEGTLHGLIDQQDIQNHLAA